MKTSSLIPVMLIASAVSGRGQTTPPTPTPYAVVARTANSAVWQRTTYEPAPSGEYLPHLERYVESATGLNHLVNGQYVPCTENIELSPDGTSASATNGQQQVYFPADIYNGVIKLVMPDGKTLESQPIGLSYFDGSNSVLLAVLTNSTGAILPSGNQVIYSNAFYGLHADLLYTYTKSGFSQDVILRQQPPLPGALGIKSQTTTLDMMTEFFNTPQPRIVASSVATAAGNLEDDDLSFGVTRMGHGRAFLVGANSPPVGVNKQWFVLGGKEFLVEEIPIVSIAKEIDTLPLFAAKTGLGRRLFASRIPLLPQRRTSGTPDKAQFLARAELPSQGFVMDYVTMNSQTNWTFQCDTTYYISGAVNLSGTNTFEGGTVLKYASGASLNLESGSSLNWLGAPYRPVVFTCKDDNSLGQSISGSTGTPSGYYANPALGMDDPATTPRISNFRIADAAQAVILYDANPVLADGQIVNCQNGINTDGSSSSLENMLFADVSTNFDNLQGGNLQAQNVTFSASDYLETEQTTPSSGVYYTNCIFADITNLTNDPTMGLDGDINGFYSSPAFGSDTLSDDSYPFQTVGGGSYYLADDSPFVNVGTTNIDPLLLADFDAKTTYPPIIYTNVTFTNALTFIPQAQRDTDIPDLGYHYDALDYVFGGCTANSNMTFTAGTAVGWFRTTSGYSGHEGQGLYMQNYAVASFQGTEAQPDYWVRLNTVQENDTSAGYGPGGLTGGDDDQNNYDISPSPTVDLTFTRCTDFANDDNFFRDDWGYLIVRANHCEFYGGGIGGYIISCCFTNCLMGRTGGAQDAGWPGDEFIVQNCTWIGGSLYFTPYESPIPIGIRDSAFDGTTFTQSDYATGTNASYDYNAFTNGMAQFSGEGTSNVTVAGFDWEAGPLGNYYLPANSPLIDYGDVPASQVGLYHFTTQTNLVWNSTLNEYAEVPEGAKSPPGNVDLGYHYVAVDQYGNPLDTSGDDIPDYLEDSNGDGVFDAGDLGNWQTYNSANGLSASYPLEIFTPLK